MASAANKHWPHWKDIVSAIFILTGIILIIADEPIELSSTTLQGVRWGILAALLFASRDVLQKNYFADVSSDKLILYQMLAILLLALYIDLPPLATLNTINWLAQHSTIFSHDSRRPHFTYY
ncbi:MAG: drug/metabolite transporter (DMT)-like permease [Cellvibrionaceae bacterium]|jgi:drug/metabolite transporter (DMT)-like permease